MNHPHGRVDWGIVSDIVSRLERSVVKFLATLRIFYFVKVNEKVYEQFTSFKQIKEFGKIYALVTHLKNIKI